jgi:hypothetical protein
MHRWILLCALGGSLAWGQGNPALGTAGNPARGQEAQKAAASNAADAVAMDAPVMTIKGFCPERKSSAGSQTAEACETVITREQFEKMAVAIRPNMTVSVKQQLASLYPRLLVMAQAAEKMGLDKQSPYEQMIEFSRLQILTQGLTRKVQQQSEKVPDDEVAEYYKKNEGMFEEYTLQRLYVPLRRAEPTPKNGNQDASTKDGQEQAASSQRELEELADKLRARAAAGEDFLKLQREAFAAAGVTVASPTTSMGTVRRTALPATHKEIFELKTGEVSPVVTDAGGHYIYKVEAKDRLALDKVKDKIRQTLESQKAKEALDKIQNSYSTDLNEQYFATPVNK